MTDLELKKLKDDLWHAADVLRSGAHLAANKYGQPILGLIFLRYADILFKQHKQEIETEYEKLKGGRREKSIIDITIEKCFDIFVDIFRRIVKDLVIFQTVFEL